METSDHIKDILNSVPEQPGCYLMKDQAGKVIYIGKAINLRHRVRSYFHASAQKNPRTSQLVSNILDIEWFIVKSELEALILEMNLIKEYQPFFNVQLKDDKRYPYIKIHWADPFPRVSVTRKVEKDGSRYYGPYINVWAVNQTMDLLRKIFPYLTCNRTITGEDQRACLYYDIQLCTAPCIGRISQEDYREMIKELGAFLNGRTDNIIKRLEVEMQQASADLKYERAAQLRDTLDAVQRIVEEQRIISTKFTDSDVIALADLENDACIQVFFIRGGKLTGREYFLVENIDKTADKDLLAEVIKQFYDQAPTIPPEILLPREIEEAKIINQWLKSQRGGKKVELIVPRRGEKKKLVAMAAENAASMLTALKTQENSERERAEGALTDLQSQLNLNAPPLRIECYDISNTQGTALVGSMVVFLDGRPEKAHYRQFNIRTVQGPDDYASMDEVLRRRLQRLVLSSEERDKPGRKPDPSFSALPDLILVDGGKGQLNRAIKVLAEFDLLDTIPVAGLAKRYEEVFIPGEEYPVSFEKNSPGLHLLQRSRDEAHRFAITAHRKRRSKKGLESSLEKIPGVGPSRRQELLKKFHTIQNIRDASLEELSQTPKITLKIAQSIKKHLE
ncbi:MAG: excinuclease ABC subunit UvrC [Anaerolineales bacterium]|nr:excinuclease ABC subunit UvrC [Anaerolineales bacterium]